MKLTPPSPKYKLRRLQFFMDHPDHPGAKKEVLNSITRIQKMVTVRKRGKVEQFLIVMYLKVSQLVDRLKK